MRKQAVYSWGAAIVCFLVLMIVTPAIPQSQQYHDFADKREFLGIQFLKFPFHYSFLDCSFVNHRFKEDSG